MALFIVTVGLRLVPFFHFHPIELSINAPLAQFFFNYWKILGPVSNIDFIVATLVIYFQSLQVNYITTQHGVLHKDSMLPALLFATLNSIYPEQMVVSPQIIANTFLLIIIQRLFYLYESKKPLYLVLDAGMYLGIAILFNYDVINYLPFILISVVALTSFNISYLIVALIGIIIPLYFTTALFYLSNHLNDFMAFVEQSFTKSYFTKLTIDPIVAIPWFVMLVLLLFTGITIQSNFYKNNVKTRRILLTLGLLLLFSILIVPLEEKNFIFNLIYLSTPTSMVVAYFFLSSKRFYLKEILYLFFVASCFYFQLIH
ncbi:MAG: hypothetical protein NTU43_03245 [Bacteroidetes bacterium]|nr:hypothetical protein [Bacteroidota bacterium]